MRLLVLASAFALSLSSCNDTAPAPPVKPQDPTSIAATTPADTDLVCPRGVPTPALKSGHFSGSRFKLFPDSVSALEVARLPNGDTLQIYHHGCEYVIYTFRFSLANNAHDTTDTPYWLHTSACLVNQVLPDLTIPLSLSAGARVLDTLAASGIQYMSPGFEVNIDSTGDMRFYYTLDRVSHLATGSLLEFSFLYGPL